MRGSAVFALVASTLAGLLGACNALTGASDLSFDETPATTSGPDASGPETAAVKQPDPEAGAGADAARDAAGAADAAPCTVDAYAKTESVSSSPTAAVDDPKVGVVPWTITPIGGTASAHLTLNASQITHYLRTSALGFAATVPQDALIRGIQVQVTRLADFPDEVTDYGVLLVKDNLPGGESKTSGATWESIGNSRNVTYGGAADLWKDPTRTTADVRATGFGVALAARGISAAMTDVQVTQMTVTVTFVRCAK